MSIEEIIQGDHNVLWGKAQEYSEGDNRFRNFEWGAQFIRLLGWDLAKCTPEQCAFLYATKHLECVVQILSGKLEKEYAPEKIGDLRRYLVLIEAMLMQKQKGEQDEHDKHVCEMCRGMDGKCLTCGKEA